MKKGILSALVLTLALAPTVVGVNAHYDSTLNKSGVKTVLKETKLTVDQAKKEMESAKAALDAKRQEAEKVSADKNNKFNEMQNAEIAVSKTKDELEVLPDKINNSFNEMQNAEIILGKFDDENGNLEEKLSDAQAKLTELKNEYNETKAILDEALKVTVELGDKKTKLQNEKVALDARIDELLNTLIPQAKAEGDEAKLATLRAELQEKDDRKTKMTGELYEVETNFEDAVRVSNAASEKLNGSLFNDIQNAEISVSEINDKINERNSLVESKNNAQNAYQTLLGSQKQALKDLETYEKAKNDATSSYQAALDNEKKILAELPALEKAYNDAKAAYEQIASQDKPASNTEEKKVSGWDDGGPFTTNAEGDVFDRWGNLIYDAPAKTYTVNGYSLVNTSDC